MTGADELHFCWNDDKAASNLAKHGVSFELATYVFDDPMRIDEDDAFARGESRNVVIGRVDGILLTVVCACVEDDLCRIISARAATAHERKAYEQNLLHS